jgi:hypothetical protein
MGFLGGIFDKLKKASRSRFEADKSSNLVQFLIDTKHDKYFTLEFDHMEITHPNDIATLKTHVVNGYSEHLGNLYIEAIDLFPEYTWNGLPGSCFEIFIKKEFPSSKFELVKSYDDNFCEFIKYKLDNNEVGLIWFSLNQTELFIFDQKGKLFNDLLKMYSIDEESLFIEEIDNSNLKVKNSMTMTNITEDFFRKKDS